MDSIGKQTKQILTGEKHAVRDNWIKTVQLAKVWVKDLNIILMIELPWVQALGAAMPIAELQARQKVWKHWIGVQGSHKPG